MDASSGCASTTAMADKVLLTAADEGTMTAAVSFQSFSTFSMVIKIRMIRTRNNDI
jgi:hypothetical protein